MLIHFNLRCAAAHGNSMVLYLLSTSSCLAAECFHRAMVLLRDVEGQVPERPAGITCGWYLQPFFFHEFQKYPT